VYVSFSAYACLRSYLLLISEYDFFNFNTKNNDSVNVITHVSPSLNANGADRPLGFAIQVDDLPIQSSYFLPPAPAGKLPSIWGDFVKDSIVPVQMTFSGVSPGAHTLKVRLSTSFRFCGLLKNNFGRFS